MTASLTMGVGVFIAVLPSRQTFVALVATPLSACGSSPRSNGIARSMS